MDKHPDNGRLFSPKKKWTIKPRKDMKEPEIHTNK